MTIGERIKLFREQNSMTQEELAAKLDTTKQTIYKYENNIITNIPSDKLQRIADIFQIKPTVLMGWDSEFIQIEQDMYKIESRKILNNTNATLDKKYTAKISEYLCLYARSVRAAEARGDLNHPSFNSYVAKMLNQSYEKSRMDEELYNMLLSTFGRAAGMKNGTSYWYPQEICCENKKSFTQPSKDELTTKERRLISLYNKLNAEGQKRTVDYIDDLVASGRYSSSSSTVRDSSVISFDYSTPAAAHERTDIEVTDEMRKHDDDIMNSDDF